MTKGESVEVKTEKDQNGYWQWTAIGEGTSSAPTSQSPSSNAGATRVTGSNYETREERTVKQKYIVKQSSLSVAANLLAIGAKNPPTAEEVISLANKFVEYVFSVEEKSALDLLVDEMVSDIPD
jgi:hypothetical protein